MAHFEFYWTPEIIEHLAEHGVSPEDFEEVVKHPRHARNQSVQRAPLLLGRDA